ncbi:MAG: hypothetical protein F4Y45_04410 [Acidobacteria bacterium]|nr:hypothetical protein [Acidobacteriota bacterium]MYJ06010.1 hypothetical protein [Acidobacteriota bacterium]
MTNEQSIDNELFAGRKPDDTDSEALLAQYKLFVQTSEALAARRQGVNTFFLSVNSIVLAASGLLLRDGLLNHLESFALICLSLGGSVLCFAWWRLIVSYRQLSTGKFAVIHALERRLPARLFAAEWIALGCGKDPNKYRPFTRTETGTPWVFVALHLAFVCAGLYVLKV